MTQGSRSASKVTGISKATHTCVLEVISSSRHRKASPKAPDRPAQLTEHLILLSKPEGVRYSVSSHHAVPLLQGTDTSVSTEMPVPSPLSRVVSSSQNECALPKTPQLPGSGLTIIVRCFPGSGKDLLATSREKLDEGTGTIAPPSVVSSKTCLFGRDRAARPAGAALAAARRHNRGFRRPRPKGFLQGYHVSASRQPAAHPPSGSVVRDSNAPLWVGSWRAVPEDCPAHHRHLGG